MIQLSAWTITLCMIISFVVTCPQWHWKLKTFIRTKFFVSSSFVHLCVRWEQSWSIISFFMLYESQEQCRYTPKGCCWRFLMSVCYCSDGTKTTWSSCPAFQWNKSVAKPDCPPSPALVHHHPALSRLSGSSLTSREVCWCTRLDAMWQTEHAQQPVAHRKGSKPRDEPAPPSDRVFGSEVDCVTSCSTWSWLSHTVW